MMTEFRLHPQLQNDCIELAEFPLCKLLLSNDSQFPWFILVPKIIDATEIYQLTWQEQQQLLNESSLLSELLMQTFNGDKLNVAALGNMVPQLHLHHVVRYKSDNCWPAPIWGKLPTITYSNEEIEHIKSLIIPKINEILS